MKKNKGEIVTVAMLSGALIALAFLLGDLLGQLHALKDTQSKVALGSVTQGNEYISTTTSATLTSNAITLLKTGAGSLAQCVQGTAGSAGGNIEFFDATTTNVSLRTGQRATSSIYLASIPTNVAAGTYTFDAAFAHGLTMVVTGTRGTTTCMYR